MVTGDRSMVLSGSSDFLTNKTDRHNIAELLLEVALNTIKQTNKQTNQRGNQNPQIEVVQTRDDKR
jgi:hypothetical protein